MNSVQMLKANRHDCERSPEAAADFIERVRLNQQKLTAELKTALRLHRLRIGFFRFSGGAPTG